MYEFFLFMHNIFRNNNILLVYPNIVIPFIMGYIADKYGAKKLLVIGTSLIMIG